MTRQEQDDVQPTLQEYDMDKELMIEENIRRLGEISAVYNPITGEGSTSVKRRWIDIEGFPITHMNLPEQMCCTQQVEQLAEM